MTAEPGATGWTDSGRLAQRPSVEMTDALVDPIDSFSVWNEMNRKRNIHVGEVDVDGNANEGRPEIGA